MSKRHRIGQAAQARAASRLATEAAAPAVPAAEFFGFGGSGGGFQGADNSRLRSYVYFPELDTRREISSYTRLELLRKARFLYNNHGIAKRIVNGLARMVAGTGLTPQAATKDKAWNVRAEKYFAQQTDSAFAFDVGGRYGFGASQQAQLRFKYRDGDSASVLTESAAGNARLAFFEGHQIGTGSPAYGDASTAQWNDGVLPDRNNRATAYRILGDKGATTDIAAQDLIFFCNYERAGQHRGVTVLSGAVNHLLDAAEITGFIKTGVKLANQYGYWVEYPQNSAPGAETASQRVGGNKNQQRIQTPSGPVTLKQIYGAGAIPDLPPGATLKFNSSSHPHPNNLSLIEFLIRDIAWGVGLSPEILWNIAALGGANTRFVLADAQAWIEEQQAELVRLYNSRVWIYTIAKGLKNGRLPKCEDPEWWNHVWIPPARLTVDFGREGNLQIEQLKMGVITYSRALGWQGQDFETHTNRWLDEIAFIKAGLNKTNGAALKPDDRNLSWDDLQQWRNAIGQRPATDGPASSYNNNAISNDPSEANAQLAAMLKQPGAAEKLLAHLRAQPEAA